MQRLLYSRSERLEIQGPAKLQRLDVVRAATDRAARSDSLGDLPSLLFLFAGIAVLFFTLRRPRTQYRTDAPGAIVRNRRPEGVKFQDSMDRSLIQLEETAREVAAKLDTRIRLLDGHVRAADQASTRLEDLLARAAELQPGIAAGEAQNVTVAGDPVALPARRLVSEERPGATPESSDESSAATPDPVADPEPSERSSRVHELADEGTSDLDIAREMGLPVGEVKLIMRLRDADRLTSVTEEPPPEDPL